MGFGPTTLRTRIYILNGVLVKSALPEDDANHWLARSVGWLLMGPLLTGAAAADPPGGARNVLLERLAPAAREVMFTNDSTNPARVEFLDRASRVVWCTDLVEVAGYERTFPMAPWATLYCLLERGQYRVRIHQNLTEGEGSRWIARVETVDVK